MTERVVRHEDVRVQLEAGERRGALESKPSGDVLALGAVATASSAWQRQVALNAVGQLSTWVLGAHSMHATGSTIKSEEMGHR